MPTLPDLMRDADRIGAPDLWPEVEGRAGGRPRRRTMSRVLVAAAAVAIAALGLGVAVRGFLGSDRRPGTAASPPAAGDLDPRIAAEIPVGPFPSEVGIGEGAVWVTVNSPDEPESWYLARIDPATNEVTDRIPVFEVIDVAVGEGAVWALGAQRGIGGAVFRIDPETRGVAAVIPLDCGRNCFASQVAVGGGSVWVTASGDYPEFGYVIRLDPSTETITSRLRVEGDPRDVVVTDTDAWVYSLTHFGGGGVQGGTLYRIDAASGRLVATLLEGGIPPISGVSGPPALAFGHGYLWTSVERDPDGRQVDVVRIDPQTEAPVGDSISLPAGTNFFPFSTEAGSVWFRGGAYEGTPSILRIDPSTLDVEEVLAVDFTVLDGGIDPATATMWVSNYERTVTRIDLR